MLMHTYTVDKEKFTYTLVLHRNVLTHIYTVHIMELTRMLVVNRDMLTHTYTVHRDNFHYNVHVSGIQEHVESHLYSTQR